MVKLKAIIALSILGTLVSCSKTEKADGYGNFEATEITISAEANGKILFLNLEEGAVLKQNSMVGLIDTVQLHLSKKQLIASKNSIASKSKNVLSQINVFKEQLKTATIEKNRIHNMFAEDAATKRQVDEADGKVNILQEQIKSVKTQNMPIINELETVDVAVQKIEDQMQKCKIVNPVRGTVLQKYAEPNEITTFGKPIYKIADLDEMILRVYLSETQLTEIKTGQLVTVKTDAKDGMKTYNGIISWISSSAEFTPKVIQTKEERINLVYAVKVIVKNDGSLKIGIPAEIWLKNKE